MFFAHFESLFLFHLLLIQEFGDLSVFLGDALKKLNERVEDATHNLPRQNEAVLDARPQRFWKGVHREKKLKFCD